MFHQFEAVEIFFNERKQYGIKPGLARVEFLLKSVHHPEHQVKGIHVAGTNGKGSTIQFIDDVLIAHDYHVGVFTSPSFTGLTGHIFLNGKSIEKKEMIRLLNKLLPAVQYLDDQLDHPTTFEVLTVLAFMYFKERADIALIETGMGGRFDTTNCFKPIISVITTIAQDHIHFLGETIEEIAYQKAGIIKKGRPVVTGRIDECAMCVIEQEATKLSASLYITDRYSLFQDGKLKIPNKQIEVALNALTLQGSHQKDNAATAIMTLAILSDYGFRLDWELVGESITNTTLPGRFEVIHENPTIILDSAHNIAGVASFKQTLLDKEYDTALHLLFAGFNDKPLIEMLKQLQSVFTTISITTFDHPRAATVKELQKEQPKMNFQLEENWRSAVDYMFESNGEEVYCITGSLHFITMVRQYIDKRKGSLYR